MRITHTWANLAHTNSFLKITTICLSLTIILLGCLVFSLSNKSPLVIERGCLSKKVVLAETEHTPEEIESFLQEAIRARFNSDIDSPHLLSVTELKKRTLEQKTLKKQSMNQVLIIEKITFDENNVVVHTNRLISVKDIRSAFIFKLRVKFAKIRRSKLNPYGLILTDTSHIQPTFEKQGGTQ
ncbi:MAG: hypothetical protein MJK18_15860 [Bdellovibrionales bacterium]|nr:hypothetical protein [Bdellovibrionales bacterium]